MLLAGAQARPPGVLRSLSDLSETLHGTTFVSGMNPASFGS